MADGRHFTDYRPSCDLNNDDTVCPCEYFACVLKWENDRRADNCDDCYPAADCVNVFCFDDAPGCDCQGA
jgi:hypothetical protein